MGQDVPDHGTILLVEWFMILRGLTRESSSQNTLNFGNFPLAAVRFLLRSCQLQRISLTPGTVAQTDVHLYYYITAISCQTSV